YTPDTNVTGQVFLEYFRDKLNEIGSINYKENWEDENYLNHPFNATIRGSKLFMEGVDGNSDRRFWLQRGISMIHSDGYMVEYERDDDHFSFIGDIIRPKQINYNCNDCGTIYQNYKYGIFKHQSDPGLPFIQDQFPDDPSEFWDTDGDGIGDNSDNDIDGDGTNNAEDQAPFDPDDIFDIDRDGIGDANDPESMLEDNDGDGLSNFDELNVTMTDPFNWDSDGDGFSDGPKTKHDQGDSPNVVAIMDLGSTSALTQENDRFEIRLDPYNANFDEFGVYVEYTPNSPITGQELLEYFRDKLNEIGGITHRNYTDDYEFDPFVASIKNTRLILTMENNQRNFHISQGIATIAANGSMKQVSKINENGNVHSHFVELGRFFRQRNNNCDGCS
ncbi:hypothetical protein EB151_13365, partial [archaeon]|nr:hypothetical protein [archaeon]